jgi:hypothetical protein
MVSDLFGITGCEELAPGPKAPQINPSREEELEDAKFWVLRLPEVSDGQCCGSQSISHFIAQRQNAD